MALPAKKLDESAIFELGLHAQLLKLDRDFNHTRVDLKPFNRPHAKIDCITISRPVGITNAEICFMQLQLNGTVKRPNNRPRTATIHDPSNADLRFLTKHYADAQIDSIEIAIDVHLPNRSNDLYLFRGLKLQLRHCLAPQRHQNFPNTERKFFDLNCGQYIHDAASNSNGAPTTVTYSSAFKGHSLKLYLKTRDQNKPSPTVFVRTELRIESPSWAGLEFVSDLNRFGQNLRKYCSDAFFIGKGFNLDDIAGTKWKKYGSAWDIKGQKNLQVRPDPVANKKFGDALSELGRAIIKATGR